MTALSLSFFFLICLINMFAFCNHTRTHTNQHPLWFRHKERNMLSLLNTTLSTPSTWILLPQDVSHPQMYHPNSLAYNHNQNMNWTTTTTRSKEKWFAIRLAMQHTDKWQHYWSITTPLKCNGCTIGTLLKHTIHSQSDRQLRHE